MQNSTRKFNRLKIILDKSLTVSNALDLACDIHGDKSLLSPDVSFSYDDISSRNITANQLRIFCNKVSNFLINDIKLNRYDRIGIYKSNSLDYYLFGLAIIRAGGIAVPINSGVKGEGLINYIDNLNITKMFVDSSTLTGIANDFNDKDIFDSLIVVDEAQGGFTCEVDLQHALVSQSEIFDACPLNSDDITLIVHTSGTTGFPKGVMHSSGTLTAGIKGQFKIQPLKDSDKLLTVAPFNHFISFLSLYSAMLAGLRTWCMNSFDAEDALKIIEREKITTFFGFPDSYALMLKFGLDEFDLDSIRTWISGADAAHEVHQRAFVKKGAYFRIMNKVLIKSIFIDTFGSSEVGFAALFRFTFSSSNLFQRFVGRPTFAGPKVKIANENGKTVSRNKVGFFMVKGPTIFKGYWNNNEKLNGVFKDSWFRTGDVGYRDTLGRYFHLDRDVDVIETENGSAYTLVIEEHLLNYPGVAEVVAIGVPHPDRGYVPFALVEPHIGKEINVNEIKAWLNNKLQATMHVEEVICVACEGIPRGVTGKVLKRKLRSEYSGYYNINSITI